jgi:uncharacterized protein with von Willebrand factor type A (vWA) domain
MDQTLAGYVRALRAAGADASTAEALDAARVVSLVGYGDRDVLKASLGVVLAKSEAEKALHEVVFERYFQAPATAEPAPSSESMKAETRLQGTGDSDVDALLSLLAQGQGGGGEQPGAALSAALQRAARASDVDDIRFAWQAPFLSRRMLESMGIAATGRPAARQARSSHARRRPTRRAAWAPRATPCNAMRAASSTSATRSTAAPPPTPS